MNTKITSTLSQEEKTVVSYRGKLYKEFEKAEQ
jgi:hypothetical protein